MRALRGGRSTSGRHGLGAPRRGNAPVGRRDSRGRHVGARSLQKGQPETPARVSRAHRRQGGQAGGVNGGGLEENAASMAVFLAVPVISFAVGQGFFTNSTQTGALKRRWLITANKGFADLRQHPPGSHAGVILGRSQENRCRNITPAGIFDGAPG
jgi:hypothetical protein